MNYLRFKDGVNIINILVSPKSNSAKIKGIRENRLWIALTSPPDKGKANNELIRFLSKLFKIPKSSIEISSGLSSKRKSISIIDCDVEVIKKIIETKL